jgi:O-antigen/teichoic acid export membrane protein
VGSVLNVLVTFQYSRHFLPVTWTWQPATWKKVLQYSLPISLTAVLSFLYFKSDTVLLSVLPLGPDRSNTVEVGVYGAAYKVVEMLLLIPSIFVGNIFPVISAFWAQRDARLTTVLQEAFNLMAIFGALVTVIVAVLARPIILFIAGPGFIAAALPLQILAITIFITYFTSIYTFTALAINAEKQLAKVYVWGTIFNIGANIILIPLYSYLAAAVVTGLTELIVLAGAYMICRRATQVAPQLKMLFSIMPITAVAR